MTRIIPKIWGGDPCYVVGGGASLSGFDVDRLRNRKVIAVNCAYMMADWFDAVFWGDRRWFRLYGEGLKKFPGLKVTTAEDCADISGVTFVPKSHDPGLMVSGEALSWNESSGACAIDLAATLGAGSIYLLGFDMRKAEDGKRNYHDLYAKDNSDENNPYPMFMKPFQKIAEDLAKLNVGCFNVTPFVDGRPYSRLDVFQFLPLGIGAGGDSC
jgi:hypothetical protein